MSQFTNRMDTETFQVFWAALQRGEFISGAAEQVGTYRKQGSRWVAGVRRCSPAPRPRSQRALFDVRLAREDCPGHRGR
jgi:hypothetical protein